MRCADTLVDDIRVDITTLRNELIAESQARHKDKCELNREAVRVVKEFSGQMEGLVDGVDAAFFTMGDRLDNVIKLVDGERQVRENENNDVYDSIKKLNGYQCQLAERLQELWMNLKEEARERESLAERCGRHGCVDSSSEEKMESHMQRLATFLDSAEHERNLHNTALGEMQEKVAIMGLMVENGITGQLNHVLQDTRELQQTLCENEQATRELALRLDQEVCKNSSEFERIDRAIAAQLEKDPRYMGNLFQTSNSASSFMTDERKKRAFVTSEIARGMESVRSSLLEEVGSRTKGVERRLNEMAANSERAIGLLQQSVDDVNSTLMKNKGNLLITPPQKKKLEEDSVLGSPTKPKTSVPTPGLEFSRKRLNNLVGDLFSSRPEAERERWCRCGHMGGRKEPGNESENSHSPLPQRKSSEHISNYLEPRAQNQWRPEVRRLFSPECKHHTRSRVELRSRSPPRM